MPRSIVFAALCLLLLMAPGGTAQFRQRGAMRMQRQQPAYRPAPQPQRNAIPAQQQRPEQYATPERGASVEAAPQRTLAPIARQQGQAPRSGEHLGQWMQQHGNLTPEQQHRALEAEPGFHDLPQATQQRMSQRLDQLNAMTPEQRQRTLDRTESMERLTPEQRGQVRNSMSQLGSLPPARRQMVERTFRSLRGLPPEQRQAYLNDPRVRAAFSPQEMNTLNGLMNVEPLLPR